MNAEKDWLQQLAGATSYSDLQSIFSRMSAQSKLTTDVEALVAEIDEAIRRIEAERARDQTELDQLTAEYDAFKQQQSGVVGWFKRKLPFTEARSQELEHRDAVNDQSAEILADNFIIARAQILKERIAAPTMRRMGQRSTYWRDRLLQSESLERMREYGNVLRELIGELATSKIFVEMVSSDIDGFAKARFTGKEDQQRKSADLIAGKEECKSLSDELTEKENLKSAALVTLKGLLIKELSERDKDFRNTQHRFELLKKLLGNQPKTIERTEEHLTNLKALSEILEELETLPDRREKIIRAQNALKQSLLEATERQNQMEAALDEPNRLYQSALRQSQEASAGLIASKPLYDAYMAEQGKRTQIQPEVASDQQFEQSAPGVVMEYRRLEKAAEEASLSLRHKQDVFEAAKRAYDEAGRRLRAIQDESEALTQELRQLSDREIELQRKIQETKQGNDSTERAFRATLEPYLEDLRQATWADAFSESSQRLMDLLKPSNLTDRRQPPVTKARLHPYPGVDVGVILLRSRIDSLEKLIPALKADQQYCQNEISALSNQRKESLQRRAQMLFDQSVYSKIDWS